MARHASPVQSLLVDDRFDGDVYAHEPLSRHTTYRIGGPARFFVRANSVGALTGLVDVCVAEGTPWVVLGRGSNVLVADGGFPGVAIALGRDFRTLRFDGDRFVVGAGASLSSVVQEAFKRAIGGFEFAVGTPGTIGGALRMNAGTADEWIGQRVVSVTTYRPGRGLVRRRGDEIAWGYRVRDVYKRQASSPPWRSRLWPPSIWACSPRWCPWATASPFPGSTSSTVSSCSWGSATP